MLAGIECQKYCAKKLCGLVWESCYSMSCGGTSCKIDLLFLCSLFVLFLTTRPDRNIYSRDLNDKHSKTRLVNGSGF